MKDGLCEQVAFLHGVGIRVTLKHALQSIQCARLTNDTDQLQNARALSCRVNLRLLWPLAFSHVAMFSTLGGVHVDLE